MGSLVDIALSNAVVVTALALLAFLIGGACRKPALSHWLWVLVLLKLITPPVLTVPLPDGWVPRLRSEAADARAEGARTNSLGVAASTVESPDEGPSGETEPGGLITSLQAAGGLGDVPALRLERDRGAGEFAPNAHHDATAVGARIDAREQVVRFSAVEPVAQDNPPQAGERLGKLVVWGFLCTWLGGTLFAISMTGLRVWWFQRTLRHATPAGCVLQNEVEGLAGRIGIRRPPEVWLVPGTVLPMLWAVIGRPRLLFPAKLVGQLTPEARQTLLLHELAHLRRRDHWVRILEAAVTALYWWHPVVWWARRQIQSAEEACCDGWVVSEMPSNRQCYAEALVQAVRFLSDSRSLPPLAASGLGTFILMKRRVRAIMLKDTQKSLSRTGRVAMAAVALICLGLSPTLGQNEKTEPGAVEPAAQGRDEPAEPETVDRAEQVETARPKAPTRFKRPPRPLAYEHESVWGVAFSPDGKYVATCGAELRGSGTVLLWDAPDAGLRGAGTVRLWDAAGGEQLAAENQNQGIASLAFSPDGRLLATGSPKAMVTIRRVPSFEAAVVIPAYRTAGVAFSPDGKTLATAGQGPRRIGGPVPEVLLWDVATGKQVLRCEGDLFRLFCVAFSPDGRLIAAGGGNDRTSPSGDVVCWDAVTGRPVDAFEGHTAPIHSLAFSPDGKTLATGSEDRTARLWNVQSGKLTTTIEGHKGYVVHCVAFSPDGKRLATAAGGERRVKLWNVGDGTLVADLAKLDMDVRSIAFSPNGDVMVIGGRDGIPRLWDVARRREIRKLERQESRADPPRPVLCVACSPDGKTVASSHDGNDVRLRDAETGEVLGVLSGHDDVVSAVVFAPDGKTLATSSCDKTLKLWDVRRGKERATLRGHANWVLAVAFSSDGKTLASGGDDKTVRLWDAKTGREKAVLEGHDGLVRSVAFSPDGRLLASAGGDQTVRLWDVETHELKTTFEERLSPLGTAVFSPDGKTLACAGESGTLALWDVDNGLLPKTLPAHRDSVSCLAFSADGKTLASGGLDGYIRMWDTESWKPLARLRGHSKAVTSVAFTPDCRALISGSRDKTIKRWEAELPKIPPLATIAAARGAVRFAVFSPTGRKIATGGDDRVVRLWDLEDPDSVQSLSGHAGPVNCGDFSPDGTLLATGGADSHVVLWDVEGGSRRKTLKGHAGEVETVCFSPDGSRLASASRDRTVRIWDVTTNEAVDVLEHPDAVRSIAYSPDGKQLAAGTQSFTNWEKPGVVKLWDAASGREIASLEGHTNNVTMVRFSPDGRLLATGGGGSNVILWNPATLRLRSMFVPSWGVPAFDFLPDSQTLAVGTHTGNVSLWNANTLRETVRYEGHEGFPSYDGFTRWSIHRLDVSPDGTVIATAGRDGLVKLWPTPDGQGGESTTGALCRRLGASGDPLRWDRDLAEPPDALKYSVPVQERGAWFVAVSPDGKTLAAGGDDKTVKLLDAATGSVLDTLEGHAHVVNAGAFSPDGATLATAGFDKTVRLWDVAGRRQQLELTGHAGRVRAVLFSRDGKTVISGSGNTGLIKLWDAAGGQEIATIKQEPGVIAMALSPDGKLLATANWDRTVRVWDLARRKEKKVLEGHLHAVRSVAFSPDGKTLASTSATADPNENVKLWDVGTWRQRAALVGHTGHVHCVRFSPDGRWIATAGNDFTVRLWRAADGEQIELFRRHAGVVVAVAFLPNGKNLASTGLDGTVKLWSLHSPAPDSPADK